MSMLLLFALFNILSAIAAVALAVTSEELAVPAWVDSNRVRAVLVIPLHSKVTVARSSNVPLKVGGVKKLALLPLFGKVKATYVLSLLHSSSRAISRAASAPSATLASIAHALNASQGSSPSPSSSCTSPSYSLLPDVPLEGVTAMPTSKLSDTTSTDVFHTPTTSPAVIATTFTASEPTEGALPSTTTRRGERRTTLADAPTIDDITTTSSPLPVSSPLRHAVAPLQPAPLTSTTVRIVLDRVAARTLVDIHLPLTSPSLA
mmetsp:Transcript_5183/g.11365  ORF Transcript_5183/g.11365 Transcript_5183/m.11365 type:complete len:262 (-) Transcript_5183:1708-2493(-)